MSIQAITRQARARLVHLSRRSYARMREVAPLLRLLEAHADGRYREVPHRVIWAAAFAAAYFLMPVDAIPDVIAGLGFTDDAAVLAYVLHVFRDEVERFREWERQQE